MGAGNSDNRRVGLGMSRASVTGRLRCWCLRHAEDPGKRRGRFFGSDQ